MSLDSMKVQACIDDWTEAMYRQQEITRGSNDDLFKIIMDGLTSTVDSGWSSSLVGL